METSRARVTSNGLSMVLTNGATHLSSASSRGNSLQNLNQELLSNKSCYRIQRTIFLDNLKPLDSNAKHSQSAIDCLPILNSTKRFWENLSSSNKDISENVEYLALTDVSRFSISYYDNIADRVDKCHAMKHFGIFKVPLEICIGVSNITFVMKGIEELCQPGEIIQKDVQDRQRKITEKNHEHGRNRRSKLMKAAVQKMKPTMRKLLLEGAEVVRAGTLMGERLIVYIEDSLVSLHDDLEQSNFDESKSIILKALLEVFTELTEKSLQIQRPPTFFTSLRTIFHSLQELFVDEMGKSSIVGLGIELEEVDSLLEQHELNSSKLIHQYYKDRYKMQEAISRSPFNPCGVLSVTCFFINNVMKLKILNAKNLIPLATSRKCDSFVKINIIPENLFPDCQSTKTRVELDTHFPLYDELFEL